MYDSRCYDLAKVFLEDHAVSVQEKQVEELAQTIQDVIEDFLTCENMKLAKVLSRRQP